MEMKPHWENIARSLADAMGFHFGAWENHGDLRRIGSCQDSSGRVSPVLLFLPPGHLGDYNGLFRELSIRTGATVLFPTNRWLSPEMEQLRVRNHLEFIVIAEYLARPEPGVPLPVAAQPRHSGKPGIRAVIHAGNELDWGRIQVEIAGNHTIHIKAPGQNGSHSFPKRNRLSPNHPIGILMTLAAEGEWKNPPGSSPEYERVSKAFRRLNILLRALVPLPGDPFRKSAGAFVPVFKIRIHPKLLGEENKH